jgi:hypothetical protein
MEIFQSTFNDRYYRTRGEAVKMTAGNIRKQIFDANDEGGEPMSHFLATKHKVIKINIHTPNKNDIIGLLNGRQPEMEKFPHEVVAYLWAEAASDDEGETAVIVICRQRTKRGARVSTL